MLYFGNFGIRLEKVKSNIKSESKIDCLPEIFTIFECYTSVLFKGGFGKLMCFMT